MELKEMIKVMQHFENGGDVEFSEKKGGGNHWTTVITPSWDWAYFEYRIKKAKPLRSYMYFHDGFFNIYSSFLVVFITI